LASEFSFIGVILYVLGPYISLAEMAVRIGNMRVYIRTVDTNVRSNGTTIRALVSHCVRIGPSID